MTAATLHARQVVAMLRARRLRRLAFWRGIRRSVGIALAFVAAVVAYGLLK